MIIGTILMFASWCEYECGIDYDDKGTPKKISKILYYVSLVCMIVGYYFESPYIW